MYPSFDRKRCLVLLTGLILLIVLPAAPSVARETGSASGTVKM